MFNLPKVVQPDLAGCAKYFDYIPQVYLPEVGKPGAM